MISKYLLKMFNIYVEFSLYDKIVTALNFIILLACVVYHSATDASEPQTCCTYVPQLGKLRKLGNNLMTVIKCSNAGIKVDKI